MAFENHQILSIGGMTYSTCPVTPVKEQPKTSNRDEEDHQHLLHEVEELKAPTTIKPTKLTDSKGNLKFVNLVVAYPCAIFLFILGLCVVVIIALSSMAFADGNPFTPDDNTYDLVDIRSIAYDSLKLAKSNVTKELQLSFIDDDDDDIADNEDGDEAVERLQDKLGDVTYWIYEAKKEGGVFTEKALEHMRSSELMLTGHARYPNYCWLDYSTPFGAQEETYECTMSKSVVNIFYASQWNSTLAKEILSELTVENVQLYNSLATCVELYYLCDFIPSNTTQDDKQWVRKIANKINSMMVLWDGEGELNSDVGQVSAFLAVMNDLHTKAPVVEFFFDKNFTVDNPVTMYTRSMVFWGAPLDGANDKGIRRDETSPELLKK